MECMSAEYPHDHDPQHFLQAKNALRDLWQELPPEHQATMLLVLLKEVLKGDHQAWMADAIARLHPQMMVPAPEMFPLPLVSRAKLAELDLPAEQMATLTDADLAEIARRMYAHYAQDWFWDEFAFHADAVLREKGADDVD